MKKYTFWIFYVTTSALVISSVPNFLGIHISGTFFGHIMYFIICQIIALGNFYILFFDHFKNK